jgi:hypothetical protein
VVYVACSSASSSRPVLLYVSPPITRLAECRPEGFPRTLHPLLYSKPAGAMGRSDWPLSQPVRRRSRSITSRPSQRFRSIELSREEQLRTLSVPLVDGMSGALSTVLNVSDLGETGAGDTEELRVSVLVMGSQGERRWVQ